MATELYGIVVHEVSLVDKGANGKKFLLMKRGGDEKVQKGDRVSVSTDFKVNWEKEKLSRDWWTLMDTLRETIMAGIDIVDVPERLKVIDKAMVDFKELLVSGYAINKKATDEETTAQKARSKKYNIDIKEGKSVTMPTEYADAGLQDVDFADPVNYAYPITEDYVRAARSYSGRKNAQKNGGYTDDEWKIITDSITEAARKFKIGEFAETTQKTDTDDDVAKAGAVLSAKNKQVVQDAISALQALITATTTEDVAKSDDKLTDEQIQTEVAKAMEKVFKSQSQYVPTQADIDSIVEKMLLK